MSHRVRRSALALLIAGLALMAPGQSASAAYPPIPPITIGPLIIPSSYVVQAGTEFTVTVLGCESGQPCAISFNPTVMAPVINGIAKATFRAPCKPGVYPVSALIRGRTYSVDITVVGSCDRVPSTGLTILSTALPVGLGTIATGAALVVASRARRRPRFAT